MTDQAQNMPVAVIDELLRIMARLRDPDAGCPWDIEQDFASIAPYTIEEAYEVADAIKRGDMNDLRDELGDLLLQVVFHARIAEEAGAFAFADVVRSISDKMTKRHPHVFAGASVADADAQTKAWEEQKAAEREERARAEGRQPSALDGVTAGLPALSRAEKLQKRAARVGFDWPDWRPVMDKFREEIAELEVELAAGDAAPRDRIEDEVGDLLFNAVNLARKLGIDPDTALRHANGKFEGRFRGIETLAGKESGGLAKLTLEQMEALWVRVKAG